MAVYAGPNFVDRGLIYCADAGNSRSFTRGTTTIRNASVGITGPEGYIANGTIFSSQNGGIFVMDGTNDTIAVPYRIGWCPQGINGPTNMTLSLWFYYVTVGNVLVKAFDSNIGKYNFTLSSAWFSIGGSANQVFGFSSSEWGGISANVWQNFTFSISSTQLKTYRNGVLTATRSHNITTAYTDPLGPSYTQYVGIGGWPFAGDMNGFVGPLHFYNVVLTDSEIMQNFNSMRRRFNI
jgi:hypothetical protein